MMIIPAFKYSWRILIPSNTCRLLHHAGCFIFKNVRLTSQSSASIHYYCALQSQSRSEIKSVLKSDNDKRPSNESESSVSSTIDKYIKQIESKQFSANLISQNIDDAATNLIGKSNTSLHLTPLGCLKNLEEIINVMKDDNKELSTEERKKLIELEKYLNKDDLNKWHLPTLPVLYSHLMELYNDDSARLIEKVVSTIKWQMPRAPLNAALLCYILQCNYNIVDTVKSESYSIIRDRVPEISNSKNVKRVFSNQSCFPDDFLFNIDKNVLVLVESFTIQECIDILLCYANARRRAVFVLAAVSNRVSNEETLTPEQVSNVLFAISDLNFVDETLLDKLANSLIESTKSIDNPRTVSSIFTSVGRLRWKNSKLLDYLCEWLCLNMDKIKEKELVSALVTLATVNYIPSCADSLKKELHNFTKFSDKLLLIDFVWALSILGWVNNNNFEDVLSVDIKTLTSNSLKTKKYIQKLQNINAVSESFKTYTGPHLNCEEIIDLPVRKSKLVLNESILKSLKASFPPPLYLNTKTENNMGFQFIAEILVDKQGRSLPIQGFSSNFIENPLTKQQLIGINNLVFFAWDYQDYSIGEAGLLGNNQMFLNIMKSKGFNCIEISHTEFNSLTKILDRVNFINKKIETVVMTISYNS